MAKATKSFIEIKQCKKVVTLNPKTKKPNGWLLEIMSDRDGFTRHLAGQAYLTVAGPGEFKGFHLHAMADYFITCLKGTIEHTVYTSIKEKEVTRMGENDFKTVFIPKGHPHGLENIGKGEAQVLVYRYPAWTPDFKEQFDIPKSEITNPEYWKRARSFIKKFS